MYRLTLFIMLCAQSYALLAKSPEQNDKAVTRSTEIVTDYERKTRFIFPMQLYKIDGQEIIPTTGTYHLKPGKHKLTLRPIVDVNILPGVNFLYRNSNPLFIEQIFEKDTRYYIGVKAKTKRRTNWKVIIWEKQPVSEKMLSNRKSSGKN